MLGATGSAVVVTELLTNQEGKGVLGATGSVVAATELLTNQGGSDVLGATGSVVVATGLVTNQGSKGVLVATGSVVEPTELVFAVALAVSAVSAVGSTLLVLKARGNPAGNGAARGELGGPCPYLCALTGSTMTNGPLVGAVWANGLGTGGSMGPAATMFLAGTVWRDAGKSILSQSSKTGFRQIGQLFLPLHETGESHFRMQFMPKTWPQSSLTGTSGFSPRRKGSEQIVQILSFSSSDATILRVLD